MMPTTPGAALLRRLYVAAASLAACAVVDARSSVHLTCDNNLRINPPEDEGVFGEDGPDGGWLATATANIAVLTEDNVALKADNANFVAELARQAAETGATLATLTAGYASLTSEVAALKQDNAALVTRVDDLEAAAAASTGSNSSASSSDLAAVKADLASLAANHTKDMATLATTMSNVVYADGVHPGGDLDFTEGSASLAILKETLPGVKVFLSAIDIKGSNIKGSVVSELLKDVAVIGGRLYCNNYNYFAADDDELVFASLTRVSQIEIRSNSDAANNAGRYTSPSSVSFPVLVFVPGEVALNGNSRLKNISMPKLVGVGRTATFAYNEVLTTLQLPSLLNVGENFNLENLPKLTTDGVTVSQQFESVRGIFYAWAPAGFTCTTDNGLKAVVNGATTIPSTAIGSKNNIASCQK